ncbi:MAG TPA: Ig-like domain-containing protein, partial [Candidatus Limnocylindrales bacterium]|nr:Ig-like domain-containing protein [Candidatus Limnocylindrales bacterium]
YYLAGMTGWGATFDGRPTLKVVNPTLAITVPVNGQRWSNIIFTVKGTVSDNAPGSNVWIQVNANGWLPATTSNQWTNWSAAASLVPGTNVLRAYAANIFGSLSTTSQLSFDFVVTNQLSVRAIGLGTVSPNYSNSWLEVGRNYSITAMPGSGFVVTNWMISTNWLGGRITNNVTLQFMMQSNLTLQPTFADVTKPTITITAPTNLQKMTNALASVVGTASDNWKVAGVWYQLNNGAWNLSPTTNSWTNWTTTLQLITGTNTMKAYAVDLGGNFSTTNSVSMVASNTFKLQLSFTNAVPLKMNGLTFSLQLSTGLNGHIQVSTNLTSWTMLTNFVGTNSIITFCDPAATNSNRRFYRAVVP